MKQYTKDELIDLLRDSWGLDEEHTSGEVLVQTNDHYGHAVDTFNVWLERGDGIAVYENQDLGHPELGAKKFVSFGSAEAQLEEEEPPSRLPDIGNEINWRYVLLGIYRGGQL